MAKSKPRINKNSKSSKLSRIFNFSTTKGKFLVFILTFAVVGGGYAAYQAFAATSVRSYEEIMFSMGNGDYNTSTGNYDGGLQVMVTDPGTSKRAVAPRQVTCNKSLQGKVPWSPYIYLSNPNWSSTSDLLVFNSGHSNYSEEIFSCNIDDNSLVKQLTSTPNFSEKNPSLSPNGAKIAYLRMPYVAGQGGSSSDVVDIYVMNADGSGKTKVTTEAGIYSNMGWSASGNLLAYIKDYGQTNASLWYVNVATLTAPKLVANEIGGISAGGYEVPISWSDVTDDSKARIVFRNHSDLYTIIPAIGQFSLNKVVSQTTSSVRSGKYSPDGKMIAFWGWYAPENTSAIFTISTTDGIKWSTPKKLVNVDLASTSDRFEWSPNGKKIAYPVVQDGKTYIHTVDVSSLVASRLTEGSMLGFRWFVR